MTNIWQQEDQRVIELEETLLIPSNELKDVPHVDVVNENDLLSIPKAGGCYWIWTNELIIHALHKHATPTPFKGGEVIYNGIAKDDVRGRIRNHLFSEPSAGWSGISVDIYTDKSNSHRKKAMCQAPKAKTAYLHQQRITSKEQLLRLNLSETERTYIQNTDANTFYFRNGIHLSELKHAQSQYRIYYITGLKSISYLEFIEKKWREVNGLPKLCSYSAGR